ncbi:DUF6571 family protein [Streptomyces sp. WMMC897]|uniref:DUF6571 family protein n=1 Tax=Streptomyces sp. WMMC897 TaxID=3014782 RepID=UPI0022B633FA|nr:DUF6571 family protein [Streptomyces sp. WMMC897]MCZ7413165.1 hypothetical protein [Streptomyces sp. WMMC897]MCZ7417801.1 hypothetical protein [Streptomyces sp. WMMC897]
MPVDYEKIISTDLSSLHDAATAWKNMGKRFGELHDNYRDHVHDAVWADTTRAWSGQGANVFLNQATITQGEYAAARDEAKAVGGMLQDAYEILKPLRQAVIDTAEDAEQSWLNVSPEGRCAIDFDKVPAEYQQQYRHDATLRTRLEDLWNGKIAKAVEAVQTADANIKKALMSEGGDLSAFNGGFNSSLKGDIGETRAGRAGELYDKIQDGEKLSDKERAELNRIMVANENDPEFSRTLLTSLGGPEGTIRVHNELAERAYADDTGNKKRHLTLDAHLANVLRTATTVDGKDTAADKRFYEQWREDLKEAGVKKYEVDFTDYDHTDAQDVRGYQSIVTLMQQGGGYDDQFLHDLADDIRAAEDEDKGGDKDIWDLRGTFAGEQQKDGTFDDSRKGWFANDPLDGVLGIMSKDPGAATAYLDPGTEAGKDRLQYLEHDRDWENVDTSKGYGKTHEIPGGPDIEDADTRTGFGAALEAAMTGNVPGTEGSEDFARHSPAEIRVLEHVVTEYAEAAKVDKGAIPENMRQNFANALAFYPQDVNDILGMRGNLPSEMNDVDIDRLTMNQFIRGVAEDGTAFRTIHDSQMEVIAGDVHSLGAEDFEKGSADAGKVAREGGQVMGALDHIRADVLGSDRDDEINRNNWNKTYQYHAAGALVTGTPILGDTIQRLIDIGAGQHAENLNNEVTDKTTEELIAHYSKNGYPRLEQMFVERADQVGLDTPDMRKEPFQNQVLGEASDGYSFGIDDAEGSTGVQE